MFWYFRARRASGVMVSWALAVLDAVLVTVAAQCETISGPMLVGEQELVSVTAPCFLKNATGMNTGFAPDFGTSRIQPKYWPVASVGAEMVIGKVSVPSFATLRVLLPRPTVIVAPAGADTCTLKACFLPDTFSAVRCVVSV